MVEALGYFLFKTNDISVIDCVYLKTGCGKSNAKTA
jgi:hypothetical protein